MSRLIRLVLNVFAVMAVLATTVVVAPSAAAQQSVPREESQGSKNAETMPVSKTDRDEGQGPSVPSGTADAPVVYDGRRTILPTTDLPESEPSGLETVEPSGLPVPDERDRGASETKEGFVPGESVYIGEDDQTNSHPFMNPDGTVTVVVSEDDSTVNPETGEFEKVRSDNGKAEEVSIHTEDVVETVDATAEVAQIVAIGAESISISVARGDHAESPGRAIDIAGESVSTSPFAAEQDRGISNSEPKLDGLEPSTSEKKDAPDGWVVYENVLGDTDVEVLEVPGGVRVDFVIESSEDAAGLTQTVDVPTDWTAHETGGIISFLDSTGANVANWAGGIASDQTGLDASSTVQLEILEAAPGQVTAGLVVDNGWLADPSRIFPVRLDPVLVLGTHSNTDTMIFSGQVGSFGLHSQIHVGGASDRAALIDIQMDLESQWLEIAEVNSAAIYLNIADAGYCTDGNNFSAERLTASFDHLTTVWPGPSAESDGDATVSFADCSLNDEVAIPVANIVEKWIDGTEEQYGFRISASGTPHVRAFHSRNAAVSSNLQPRLHINFEVPAYEAVLSDVVGGAPGGAEVTLPVPSSDNGSYPIHAENLSAANWSSGEVAGRPLSLPGEKICLSYHSIEVGKTPELPDWGNGLRDGMRTCPAPGASPMFDYWTTVITGLSPTIPNNEIETFVGLAGADLSTPDVRVVYLSMLHEGVTWFETATGTALKAPIPIRWTEAPAAVAPLSGSLFSSDELVTLSWEEPYEGTANAWSPDQYRVKITFGGQVAYLDPTSSKSMQLTPDDLGGYTGEVHWQVQARDEDNELYNASDELVGPKHWTALSAVSSVWVQPAALGTNELSQQFGGVDPTTGNYYTSFADVLVPSVSGDLGLVRHHNSIDRTKGMFGPGISTSFEMRFDCLGDCAAGDVAQSRSLTRADGSREVYSGTATELTSVSNPENTAVRTGVSVGAYEWEIAFSDGSTMIFEDPNAGYMGSASAPAYGIAHLAGRSDEYGHDTKIALHTASGYPDVVMDVSSGRALGFEYTSYLVGGVTNYLVSSVTTGAATGSGLHLGFVAYPSVADEFEEMTYTYDIEYYMDSSCNAEGECVFYGWTSDGRAEIHDWATDEQRNTLGYDPLGRVEELTFGASAVPSNNDVLWFEYDLEPDPATGSELMTTVNDARSLDWHVEYTKQGQIESLTYPSAPGEPLIKTTYEHTGGLRTSIVDVNENAVHLVYGTDSNLLSFNRLLTRENAEGEETTYRYDPANYVTSVGAADPIVTGPSHVCDPRHTTGDAYCTVNKYDEFGRMVESQQAGETASETWEYTTGAEPAVGGGTAPEGLLKKHTAPLDIAGTQGVTTYEYASNGDLIEQLGPFGPGTPAMKIVYGYDGLGRMTTETHHFTDKDPITQVETQRDVQVSATDYDNAGRPERLTGPVVFNALEGQDHQLRTVYDYNTNGQLETKTEQDVLDLTVANRVWVYHYDHRGREIDAVDPEGGTASRSYDGNGNVESVTDAEGNTVRTTYDERNLVDEVTALNFDPDGSGPAAAEAQRLLSDSDHDDSGRLTKTTVYVAPGVDIVELYEYDNADRLLTKKVETPSGTVTVESNSYDEHGFRESTTIGNAAASLAQDKSTTSYEYYPNGLVETETVAGTKTTYEYDDVGNPTKLTLEGPDPITGLTVSAVSETQYDYAQRAVELAVQNGTDSFIVTSVYDDRGLLIETVDARGNMPNAVQDDYRTSMIYDAAGQLVEVRLPEVSVGSSSNPAAIESSWSSTDLHPVAKTGYNAFGDVTHTRDGRGHLTVSVYDRNGRKILVTHPTVVHPTQGAIVATESWGYDLNGNVESYTSRLGHTTSYVFDSANRAVKQIDPAIADPADGVTPMARGEHTTEYDYIGRVTRTTSPEGSTTSFEYDERSRVIYQHTQRGLDGLGSPILATEGYVYSDLGFVTNTTDPTSVETTSTYDSFGQVLSTSTGGALPTTYSYDALGRLRQQTRVFAVDGADVPIEWSATETRYDQAGRPVVVIDSDNVDALVRSTSTSYNPDGTVESVTSGRGGVTTYEYDALARLLSTEQEVDDTTSITYSYGYDAAGNATSVTDGDGHVTRYVFNEWDLMTHTLEPDSAMGVSEAESTRLYVVGYNAAGQSNYELSPGGGVLNRAYNELALPTIETVTHPGRAAVATESRYDRQGRVVVASHPVSFIGYEYDDRGLLVEQTGGAGDASFTYDAAGRTQTRDDEAGLASYEYDPATGLLDKVSNPNPGGGGGGTSFLDVTLLVDVPSSLNTLETSIQSHLVGDGHTVNLVDASSPEVTVTDDLIIIANSGGLGNKYETQSVPIFDLMPWHWSNHGLTTGSITYGWGDEITITDSGHGLAGGLAGTVEVLDSANGFAHVTTAQLGGDADVVADFDSVGQHLYFGYDTGDTLADTTTAPERRVGFSGFHDASASVSSDGWVLFDAAVSWATDTTTGGGGGTGAWDIDYTYDSVGRLDTETFEGGGVRTYGYDAFGRLSSDTLRDAPSPAAPSASTTYSYSCDHELIAKDVNLPGNDGEGLQVYTYDHAGRLTSWDGDAAVAPVTCPGPIATGGTGAPSVLLLVGDDTSLTNLETDISGRLTGAGHSVTVRVAGDPETTVSQDLIVIASSSGLGDKYETQSVPIFDLMPWHWSNHGLITGGVTYGWGDDIVITDAAHDLAAGLSGTTTVLSSSNGFAHVTGAQLGGDADVVADFGASGQHAYFGYDTGDTLADATTAPARRVGFSGFHSTGGLNASPDGWLLFDAAVAWAAETVTGGAGAGDWALAGEIYTYDSRGNRLTAGVEAFEYDNRNRLTEDPNGEYSWHDDGTLDVFEPYVGSDETYVFDAGNRLIQVSDGTNTTGYTYDAMDRIASRDSDAFSYAGGELDPLSDGNDLFQRMPGGSLLAYETTAGTVFPYSTGHRDLNGLFTADGVLSDTATFDPYGDPVHTTGSIDPVLGFQTDYTDPVTEHVWMGARWYQPSSATFLSRDTVFGELRSPFTLNRYTYAINNPIEYWDPDGNMSCRSASDVQCFFNKGKARVQAKRTRANSTQKYWKKKAVHGRVSTNSRIEGYYGDKGIVPTLAPITTAEVDAHLANLSQVSLGDGQKPQAPPVKAEGCGWMGCTIGGAVSAVGGEAVNFGHGFVDGVQAPIQGLVQVAKDPKAAIDGLAYCSQNMEECAYAMATDFVGTCRDEGISYCVGHASGEIAVSYVTGSAAASLASRSATATAVITRLDNLIPSGRGRLDALGCSFAASTLVVMADGSAREISEISPGDEVLAADAGTGRSGGRAVLDLIVHDDVLVDLEIGGSVVTTTEDHPFWNHSDQEFQRADALSVGDLVLGADGDLVAVDGLVVGSERDGLAYNLHVREIHTYFVVVGGSEALVHNSCPIADAPNSTPGIKPGSANGPTSGQRFPESVRRDALAENPSTCVYCRLETDAPQVDHAIPRSRGGDATLPNAQTTCGHCNPSKGARDFPVNPPPGFEGLWPPSWWPN